MFLEKSMLLHSFLVVCYVLFCFYRIGQASDVPRACDNGWSYYEPTNKCYKVILENMDWDTALQRCVNQDSMIVSIHSRDHNQFLINLTLKVQPPNITEKYAFWIGFYETYNYSRWAIGNYWIAYSWSTVSYLEEFRWLDGSLIDYSNWGITILGLSEPNYFKMNYTPLQANRSCAVLLADYNGQIGYWKIIKGKWFDDDYGCKSIYSGTICQQDSNVPLKISSNSADSVCGDGWTKYGVQNVLNQTKDRCYYLYTPQNGTKLDYWSSEWTCESMNSTLVFIENQVELEFVLDFINQSTTVDHDFIEWFYMGLFDYNNSGIWRFVDGTSANYFRWFQNQPSYSRAIMNMTCGLLSYSGPNITYQYYNGKMITIQCHWLSSRVLCKKSAVLKTSITVSNTTFISPPTNVSALMERYNSLRSTGTGCPSNYSTYSHSYVPWPLAYTPSTNFHPCPVSFPDFSCPVPPKQYSIIDMGSSQFCDPGWVYFNHTRKCYQVVLKDMNLYDAMNTCKSMNATLASIHGEAHNDFLISLARTQAIASNSTLNTSFFALWIGFMEFNRTLEWSWLDGSLVDYVKWARIMPKMSNFDIPLVDRQDSSCTILVVNATRIVIPYSATPYYTSFGYSYHFYHNLTSFWVDVDILIQSCYSLYSGAICQKNSSVVVESQVKSKNSDLECDDGWARYELTNLHGERYNMCYYVIYNYNKFTAINAQQQCSDLNSSLAVLENQDEFKWIKDKLVIHSTTLSSYAFWINPIADDCACSNDSMLEPGWDQSNGMGNPFDGYMDLYSQCCDATLHWVNSTIESEYFPFRSTEPWFYFNKTCAAMSIDGDNGFETPRIGGIQTEFCEFIYIGAICKKKPDKKPIQSPSNHGQILSNISLQPIQTSYYDIYDTTYSVKYKSTINPAFCLDPPSDYPNMLVTRDTRHYDLSRTRDPIAICPCAGGNRLYWLPSNHSLPSDAYNSSELALIVYQYERFYGENGLWDGVHDFCDKESDCIDRSSHCPSMCICDIDGNCYKSYRYNTEVLFVPYCDEDGCFVYAAVSMGKLCQGCSRLNIENCWGCIDQDTTREHIGPSSRYIKVDRVGCYDCINIVYSKCPADNYNNVGLPGWPSVATFSLIMNNHSTWTKITFDPARYPVWWYADIDCAADGFVCTKQQSWTPYVIHPRILNREYATDAMKDIMYECIWIYGIEYNDTGKLTKNFDTSYLDKLAKFNKNLNKSDSSAVINTLQDTNHLGDQFDWNFLATINGTSLFNEARRGNLELLMENAMRNNNFTNLGGFCSSLNYDRFRQVRPDIDKNWQDGVKTFDTLRTVNLGLNMFFGILGIFISLVVIRLIHRYTDLKTSYGYFCLIQAYIDLILLGNTVIFEGFMSVRAMYISDYDNLGNVNFSDDNATLPWRWDYLMYYIFYSSKFVTSAITFLKAFTRCIAVYLPMVFYYHAIFDEKHTRINCLVIVALMFLISLPITIPPQWIASSCKVIFAKSQYIQLDTCSQLYWWVQTYAEFVLAMLCFVFDMATFYKLIRINRNRVATNNDNTEAQKRLLERLFLIQNCGDLASFFIMFIPNIVYAVGCQYDRWHCIAGGSNVVVSMIYQITVLLFLHSSRITIWRCFDEFVSLLCQWRILRKTKSTSSTPVQHLTTASNNLSIHKKSS